MKLHEVAEGRSMLLQGHEGARDGALWTFVVKKVGVDGSNRPVLVGQAKTPMDDRPGSQNHVAIVISKPAIGQVEQQGKRMLIAIHWDTTAKGAQLAAELAVKGNRKGYGPNASPPLNWQGKSNNGIWIDDHEAL